MALLDQSLESQNIVNGYIFKEKQPRRRLQNSFKVFLGIHKPRPYYWLFKPQELPRKKKFRRRESTSNQKHLKRSFGL
jgi:hypothetical protein